MFDHNWQKTAVINAELAHAWNLLIFPIFWFKMAKFVFPGMPHTTKEEWISMFRIGWIHFLPALTSTVLLVVTDMELLHNDWKIVFFSGLLYIPFNYYGYYKFGN